MPQTTFGVPYPDPTEPVAEGAARIRDVAEHVDAHVLAELLAAGEVRSYNGQPEAIRLGGIPGYPTVYFGGSGAIYGSGASSIRTDSAFTAAGSLATGGPVYAGGEGRIYFGAANDTILYRAGAGILKTDGELDVGQAVFANAGQPYQTVLGGGGSGFASVYFGSPIDTTLYRAAAGRLKTDGTLEAGAVAIGTSGITVAGDTALYRAGAGYWQTEASLILGGKLRYGAWAAANPGAALVARVPIYDVNEAQSGYLHVYDS